MTIIIGIIILTFARQGLGISEDGMATMMYLLIGGVSIFAVIEACRPFNRVSTFLCTTTAIGFIFAVLLFHNLLQLEIQEINGNTLVIFLASLIIAYIIVTGLRTLIDTLDKELKKAEK